MSHTANMKEKLKWLGRAGRWARAGRVDLYRQALVHVNDIPGGFLVAPLQDT